MTTNKQLWELAEKATQGDWTTDGGVTVIAARSDQLNNGYAISECHGPESPQNADFIAAANPAAVLELLEENEALQAECEKLRSELDAHKAARIAYASEFPPDEEGQPDVGSIHQNIRKLKEECEELRKDAEFGRSVLAKREPGKVYGCHCDLEEGMEPDGCVIDSGERHNCIHAKDISVKEQCEYWRVITSDAATQDSKE